MALKSERQKYSRYGSRALDVIVEKAEGTEGGRGNLAKAKGGKYKKSGDR